jgi:hypothetical protein
MLEICMAGRSWDRNKPFDFTQGHESDRMAQDPEALEGQRRMTTLFPPQSGTPLVPRLRLWTQALPEIPSGLRIEARP